MLDYYLLYIYDLKFELTADNTNTNQTVKNVNIDNTISLNETILNTNVSGENTKNINLETNENNENIEVDLNELLNNNKDNKPIKIEKIEYTSEQLNAMTTKQLKEIAKEYKVKSYGSKNDIIQSILGN